MAISGHHVAMKSVGIAELKDGLSRYLRAVRRGGSLTVLDRETPVARILPYEPEGATLAVRGAVRAWADVVRTRPPPRLPVRTDSLGELLAERRGGR